MAKELLKDVTIRNTRPDNKGHRLNDGEGLYILIRPNGAKWWRFDYTFSLKRKTLSLGVYPETSLSDARRKAEEARNSIANDKDPSNIRKEKKAIQILTIFSSPVDKVSECISLTSLSKQIALNSSFNSTR